MARRGGRGAAAHAVIGVENQGKRYRSRKSKQASHSSISIGKFGCGEATFDGVRFTRYCVRVKWECTLLRAMFSGGATVARIAWASARYDFFFNTSATLKAPRAPASFAWNITTVTPTCAVGACIGV